MIQLVLIALCSLGCLIALVSVLGALVGSIRRAGQGRPFLKPVVVLSQDGEPLLLPSGLVQVHRLATSWPLSVQDEVQA
jgi:hypothetical protein